MVDCLDFLEWLGPDTSSRIFTFLDDPADLVRASAVSRSWCRFVILNGFIKSLCSRKFPDVSNFCHTYEVSNSSKNAEVGSSSGFEWVKLQREHRIFSALCHFINSSKFEGDCIHQAICASSTDNFPNESIENTLESNELVHGMPSYWSSGGRDDPAVPETLLYRLAGNLCVVNEIKIRPFQAFFQRGHPIYSASFVRFRMGSWLGQGIIDGHEGQQLTTDDSYHWTYVSPEFPMAQENVLQSFILPRPVICIGGILQIELIGRVQKQEEFDGLYYICICHVTVVGGSLAPVFDIGNLEAPASLTLKYSPDSNVRASPKGAETTAPDTSPWHTLRALINFGSNRGRNPPLVGTLLPRVDSLDEEDYADDSDDDLYLPE